jgi:hypothetical protein
MKMIKPISAMTIGNVFERAGSVYTLRFKSETVAHAHREDDGALVTFQSADLADERRACDMAFYPPIAATGLS